MKNIKLVVVFYLMILVGFSANAKHISHLSCYQRQLITIDSLPSDSLAIFLRNINVISYYGMTVNSFLNAIPNMPVNMFVSSCRMGRVSMYNACYLQVTFYPDLVVRVYVTDFTHMPKYSPTLSWNMQLFREEKIYRISIYKDSKCINGLCKEP